MFGSGEINVVGSRNVQMYAPNGKQVPSNVRAQMTSWNKMKITGSPVVPRNVPRGLKAQFDIVHSIPNQGDNQMYGIYGGRIVVPDTFPLEGITDLIKDSGETVDTISKTIEENKPLVQSIINAVKGESSTPVKTATVAPITPTAVATNVTPWYKTTAGAAGIAGGAIVLLGAVYFMTKKR